MCARVYALGLTRGAPAQARLSRSPIQASIENESESYFRWAKLGPGKRGMRTREGKSAGAHASCSIVFVARAPVPVCVHTYESWYTRYRRAIAERKKCRVWSGKNKETPIELYADACAQSSVYRWGFILLFWERGKVLEIHAYVSFFVEVFSKLV